MSEANISASLKRASDIVSAYVSNNAVPASELPALIESVHQALAEAAGGKPEIASKPPKPAVPIRNSITPEYLISLFDGQKFQTLKRHLRQHHNMTPEQYRLYWGLPPDYPMAAPNYSAARAKIAKQIGLGKEGQKRMKGRQKPA
jgi:predicted transcriptional regulator